MPVRWLSPHPHGRDFFLCGISAAQKDHSFILRVRKYELRVAEPFILCRTLVPIMTAAYYFTLPVDSADYTLAKKFWYPTEKGRTFCMDMHHIVSSKCTTKCCEKGRAYRCKSLLLNGRNNLLTDAIIFNCFVILCTTHMMACSVVAGNVTPILCHSGAELFDNDFYSAFSR